LYTVTTTARMRFITKYSPTVRKKMKNRGAN